MSKQKKVNQVKNSQDSMIGTDEDYTQRNVLIQTAQETKYYVSPQISRFNYQNQVYTPRTITTMVFTLFVLNFFAYILVPKHDAGEWNEGSTKDGFKYTSKVGIAAAIFGFVAFASVQYPDTLIKRPHPVFWRVLLGLLSIYCLFMIFLLYQPLNEGRKVFKFFDPTLGEELPEKSYASDCRVFTPEHPTNIMFNVWDATVDIHFIAHLFGWWFKMMIIRDVKVCWICSIVFELLEITFRHWLPNFWECWWDHVSISLQLQIRSLDNWMIRIFRIYKLQINLKMQSSQQKTNTTSAQTNLGSSKSTPNLCSHGLQNYLQNYKFCSDYTQERNRTMFLSLGQNTFVKYKDQSKQIVSIKQKLPQPTFACTLQSNIPIDTAQEVFQTLKCNYSNNSQFNWVYFEIKVLNAGTRNMIMIGISEQECETTKQLGTDKRSYGYKSDGKVFHLKATGDEYGPKFERYDVIGCGLVMLRKQIFFTLNGRFLGNAFSNVAIQKDKLYASVCLQSINEEIQTNFNGSISDEFKFDLESFKIKLAESEYQEIIKQPQNRCSIHELVQQYLIHYAYVETLQGIEDDVGGKIHQSMNGSTHANSLQVDKSNSHNVYLKHESIEEIKEELEDYKQLYFSIFYLLLNYRYKQKILQEYN